MLKLTHTGIGLLTKQYRSVLRKCLLLNLGLFLFSNQASAIFNIYYSDNGGWNDVSYKTYLYNGVHSNGVDWQVANYVSVYTTNDFNISNYYTKAQTDALLNYYYTFRNDKTVESAEFALFLDNEKLSNVFEA